MIRILIFFLALAVISCGTDMDIKPDQLKPGMSKEQVSRNVEDIATVSSETDFTGKHLPDAKESQSQMVLEGFPWMERERRVKLVFSDDSLSMIWINFEPEEMDYLLEQISADYGKPSHVISTSTAWMDEGVALIKNPPQFLILAESLRPTYAKFLDKVAEQEGE